jgi:hypothetical protein
MSSYGVRRWRRLVTGIAALRDDRKYRWAREVQINVTSFAFGRARAGREPEGGPSAQSANGYWAALGVAGVVQTTFIVDRRKSKCFTLHRPLHFYTDFRMA